MKLLKPVTSKPYWNQYVYSLRHGWKNALKAFSMSFAQVGLISAQIKLVQFNLYPLIFLISLGISLCWFFNVHVAVGDNRLAKFGYLMGAAIGAVVATFLCNFLI